MIRLGVFLVLMALAGCDLPPPSPETAAADCEERARASQAPEVGVTVGANSSSGPFARGSIGVSLDLLRGRDPLEVYENCVMSRTGQPPIRPPRLRDI